jgi:hypothetical protein
MRKIYTYVNKVIKTTPRLYFVIAGLVSVVWFLIRVLPKPSRAAYPCQRVAFPIATGFIVWLSVNLFSYVGLKRLIQHYKVNRKPVTILMIIPAVLFYAIWLSWYPAKNAFAATTVTIVNKVFVPSDSANSPIGIARGIFPGRVAWIHDSTASRWNGTSGYWWSDNNTDQATVSDMISQSLRQISGKDNDSAAWDTIFRYFNTKIGKGDVGYLSGEKIAIKLSLVMSNDPSSNGGNKNFTPPQTALGLLRQLVYNAGVNASDITFYDATRSIPASVSDRCKKEFPGVNFVGSTSGHNQDAYTRDTTSIHFSENLTMEVNAGHTAYLPTVVTKASYIINLAQLKGHRYVGVTGCAKNHFGSMCVDVNASEIPHAVGLHAYVAVHNFLMGSVEWSFAGRKMGAYNALVDLMGHKDLGEKTLLFMVDGLYGMPYENYPQIDNKCRWVQSPFNNNWTSSIFVSQDDVALESVLVDFYRYEQVVDPNLKQPNTGSSEFFIDSAHTITTDYIVFGNVDNVLHEAALADAPPSGTKYTPNWNGVRLTSLGVHEHWNNPIDKKYSRNLGSGNGIDLDAISPTLLSPSNLIAIGSNSTLIGLIWSNNGDTAGNIVIYRSSTVNTNFKPVARINGYESGYVDNSISLNQKYFYRLKRVGPSAYSAFSNEADATVTTDVKFELSNNSFNAYPNPAHNYLNFTLVDPNIGNIEISITNLKGSVISNFRIVKSSYEFQQSLNIEGLPQGLYCIRASSGNKRYMKLISVY